MTAPYKVTMWKCRSCGDTFQDRENARACCNARVQDEREARREKEIQRRLKRVTVRVVHKKSWRGVEKVARARVKTDWHGVTVCDVRITDESPAGVRRAKALAKAKAGQQLRAWGGVRLNHKKRRG